MAKKKKEGFESFEEASKAKKSLEKDLKAARVELKKFLKETGLKRNKDYSTDKKHGKAWKELTSNVEAVEAERKAAIDFIKANKPKKGGSGKGNTKYVYPEEVLNAEDVGLAKKKFRTAIRGKAKRAGVEVEEYLKDPSKFKDVEKPKKEKKAKAKKEDAPEGKKGKKVKKEKAEMKVSKKPSKKPKKAKVKAED